MIGLAKRLAARPATGLSMRRGVVVSVAGSVATVSVAGVSIPARFHDHVQAISPLAAGDTVTLHVQDGDVIVAGRLA